MGNGGHSPDPADGRLRAWEQPLLGSEAVRCSCSSCLEMLLEESAEAAEDGLQCRWRTYPSNQRFEAEVLLTTRYISSNTVRGCWQSHGDTLWCFLFLMVMFMAYYSWLYAYVHIQHTFFWSIRNNSFIWGPPLATYTYRATSMCSAGPTARASCKAIISRQGLLFL